MFGAVRLLFDSDDSSAPNLSHRKRRMVKRRCGGGDYTAEDLLEEAERSRR